MPYLPNINNPIQSKHYLYTAGVGALCLLAFMVTGTFQKRPPVNTIDSELFLRNNTRFRVLQLADLHLGEAENTDWGPEQDRKTFRALNSLIGYEQPDLIVLSGDQLTANNVDQNATAYYNRLATFLEAFQIPYCLIFGNHDDMDLETKVNGTKAKHPAKTSRRQLVRSDRRHKYSLTQEGPLSVQGVSNYVLKVYDSRSKVRLQIILLDSGGGSLPQEILLNQLRWYKTVRQFDVDAIAFQHIPTEQFRFSNSSCSGFQGEGGIAPLENDPANEMDFLKENDPKLHVLSVGHNHGNSYCCESSVVVCFGRHSGYGGYGRWTRGARVFDISFQDESFRWYTYVRLEDGSITDEYYPDANR